MKIYEIIDRIDIIHKMINQQSTGNPEQFADKLGVSKRQLYNIFEELKMMGAPIGYDKSRHTYYYEYAYEMRVEMIFRPLSDDESKEVSGGNNYSLNKIISQYSFSIILFTCCFNSGSYW